MKITESGTLHHTCFVVHDVEKTAAALAESGIGPWGIWTIEPAVEHGSGARSPLLLPDRVRAGGGLELRIARAA